MNIDPRLPTGARVGATPRPAQSRLTCSWERPLCVHGGTGAEPIRALSALEAAYEQLVFALALPPPRADGGLGGSDALDVYLEPAARSLEVYADASYDGAFARASGFCELSLHDPHLLARDATLCIGEAIALGLDASETPHLRRAFATSLWWLVGLPSALDVEAIDDVQMHPEWPIATRERGVGSEGSAIFFEYLESVRSEAAPGELSAALFASAASPRLPIELDYVNEPDVFDVLRHSLSEEPARFAALLVDFAVARAFIGSREDGAHLPALSFAGDFGRERVDWSLKFSSLPRRVLTQPPIDSTGSLLVRIELDEVGLGAALGFRAEWEPPVSFQWQLVKLGAHGEELGRIDIPFQQRAHEAEGRVRNLEGASAILIVGTNLEGIDLDHPFDPDVAPFEPHAATVYVLRM